MAESTDAWVNADNTFQITGRSQTLMDVSGCFVQWVMSITLPVITGNAQAVNRDGDQDRVSPSGVRNTLPADPLDRYSDTPTVADAFPLWKSLTMIFSFPYFLNLIGLIFFILSCHQCTSDLPQGKKKPSGSVQGSCRYFML